MAFSHEPIGDIAERQLQGEDETANNTLLMSWREMEVCNILPETISISLEVEDSVDLLLDAGSPPVVAFSKSCRRGGLESGEGGGGFWGRKRSARVRESA